MEEFDLSENNMTGTIPDDFGTLTELSVLSLFSNQLSGEIPESISRLPSLTFLTLSNNNLSGTLSPDLGQYSILQGFEVAQNHFTGKLPEYLCANGGLIGIAAYDNNLSGELPNSLGNCSSLLIVRVNGNRLSGSISAGLWTSTNLTLLMLSDNFFTGQLPRTLAPSLLRLEISNNKFSGEISTGLSSWKHLTVFSASNNLLLYAGTSRVNEKIDVYSFGVVLLELVTGRKANDENEDRCLADWAFQYYNQKGNHLVDALDEKIKEPHYLNVMTCVFKLGIFCTGPFPTNRPSMKEVLQILLNCSHKSGFGGGNVGSDSSDFSNDFRQGSILEGEDGSLLSIV
ncbi:Receptor protein-tyrosine kinase CEPR2 [Camellia lanceoleosa]|uniref:Receptor protein-tyrosine kinase CEPR2 n=1 Tax=Camellia lanceoleosa TaxID=1840588 RepID=A0ACC0FM20_9ERIC|nr:Receptor protein-tyrosine kinase CEPR2 [Camellia lanceoleosa]